MYRNKNVDTFSVHDINNRHQVHFRERPFNLKGELWFFVSFRKFFSDNARVRIFIYFPKFNIRLYDKNSESDYYFFPPPKSEYFFSNIGS